MSMTPIDQRAREAAEKFMQYLSPVEVDRLERNIRNLLTDQHAEDVAAGEKDKVLAERRAGIWMRLYSRGKLPSEVDFEFQKELEAMSATQPTQP